MNEKDMKDEDELDQNEEDKYDLIYEADDEDNDDKEENGMCG